MINNYAVNKSYKKAVLYNKINVFFCKECKKNNLYICSVEQRKKCRFDFDTISNDVIEFNSCVMGFKQ